MVAPVVMGVCATDLHARDEGTNAALPITMGHECVGVVRAAAKAPVPGPYGPPPAEGDLVVLDPLLPCNSCHACRVGRPNICPRMTHLGLSRDGVYADLVTVPAQRCFPVPPGMEPEAALFIEPLACALAAVEKAQPRPDDRVAIVGAGPFGLQILLVLRALGIGGVTVIDPSAARRQQALRFGVVAAVPTVSELGRDFTVVFESAGAATSFRDAVGIATTASTVVLAGVTSQPTDGLATVPMVMNEMRIMGSASHPWRFPAVAELLRHERIDVKALAGAVYDFADTAAALDRGRDADVPKVLIRRG